MPPERSSAVLQSFMVFMPKSSMTLQFTPSGFWTLMLPIVPAGKLKKSADLRGRGTAGWPLSYHWPGIWPVCQPPQVCPNVGPIRSFFHPGIMDLFSAWTMAEDFHLWSQGNRAVDGMSDQGLMASTPVCNPGLPWPSTRRMTYFILFIFLSRSCSPAVPWEMHLMQLGAFIGSSRKTFWPAWLVKSKWINPGMNWKWATASNSLW